MSLTDCRRTVVAVYAILLGLVGAGWHPAVAQTGSADSQPSVRGGQSSAASQSSASSQPAMAVGQPAMAVGQPAMAVGQPAATSGRTASVAGQTAGRPKIALVLGGGGARGAAHVGVLRELEKAGIPIDMVTGTSIGAIVGGLYCAGLSVEEIESKFRKPLIMRNYMTVPVPVSVLARPLFLMPRLIGIRPYDGFYWGNKFRNYYRSCLPLDRQNIENLKIPFTAMTVNLMTGTPYPLDHGDLPRAVQASSAIPVLRRPVPFEDALLCDGAVLINVPVDQARKMGADFVIAVPVNERLNFEKRHHFRKVGSVARRIEKIFLVATDSPQLSRADVVIHPKTDGIDILSTSSKDADKAIDAGEEAARAALPEIKAKLAAWTKSK